MSNNKVKPWTKRELSLRSGPAELAKAVIWQWHLDGEPERDLPAIKYWEKILEESNAHQAKQIDHS